MYSVTSFHQIYYSGKASSVGMKQGSASAAAAAMTGSSSGAALAGGVNSGMGASGSGAGTSSGAGPSGGKPGGTGVAGPTGSNSSGTGGRWPELTITKSPRIIHLSVGHEGQHAVLVSDEGAAFFVGTARRGEDGDASKCVCAFACTHAYM